MPRRKKIILKRKKHSTGTKRHKKLHSNGHYCIITKQNKTPKIKPDTKRECCEKGAAKLTYLGKNANLVLSSKSNTMPYKGFNRREGLSSKEKSYIICRCQAKLNRYKSLKLQASRAIRENKIFCAYGSCNGIRKALVERGWVEKLPAEKMNLSKIQNGILSTKVEVLSEIEKLFLSNLVEKYQPSFIWRTRDTILDTSINMACRDFPVLVNRLNTDALWSSKQGLCSSMKRNYWFYIEDVAEVIGPRSYSTGDSGELEGFLNDYQITACTSLLKWVLSMVANERPVFTEKGKTPLSVVLFALCRCKEYLYRKEHKDIDRDISNASKKQWNTFFKKYYRIIGKEDVFQKDTENKIPLYTAYAQLLLKQIHRFRPQLSCEGCHNIWILKPSHNSRGRGIRLASKLTVINDLLNRANDKYVIQKYIEEPLLIHETKFDIRQYCLVTSTYPLVIWMYRDCYLKFSSQKYNLKNYHESIHLTNNAVQRKYKNCAGRHKELPTANMWDSAKYKDYLVGLDKTMVWDKIIYPGMKKSIIGVMLTCQDALPVSQNRFELYGCDFILDKEYKPWLIEINSSPDLNHTTPVTAKICPAVLSDLIKVVIDHVENPSTSTGKFECIYRQPMTMPRYGTALDLFIRGLALPNEYFYKGNIDLQESYDCDDDNAIGNNIKSILDKIKHSYDRDMVMVQPEEEKAKEKAVLLKEKAVLATPATQRSQSNLMECRSAQTHSETEFTILLNKSLKNFISAGTMNNKAFDFSNLDDDPGREESFVKVNSPKDIFNEIKQLIELRLTKTCDEQRTSFTTDFMLEAATELIDFINKKELEYCTRNS